MDHNKLKPFRDEQDISYSEEWEKKRDEALLNCKIFILLMTPGYEFRPQIKKELKMALEKKVTILYCKDANLSNKHSCIRIDDKTLIRTEDIQRISFETCEELFRKVYYHLDEYGWFPSECIDE